MSPRENKLFSAVVSLFGLLRFSFLACEALGFWTESLFSINLITNINNVHEENNRCSPSGIHKLKETTVIEMHEFSFCESLDFSEVLLYIICEMKVPKRKKQKQKVNTVVFHLGKTTARVTHFGKTPLYNI